MPKFMRLYWTFNTTNFNTKFYWSIFIFQMMLLHLFPNDKNLLLSVPLTLLLIMLVCIPSTCLFHWDLQAGALRIYIQSLAFNQQERDAVLTASPTLWVGGGIRWTHSLGKLPHDFLLFIINLFKSDFLVICSDINFEVITNPQRQTTSNEV